MKVSFDYLDEFERGAKALLFGHIPRCAPK